MPIDYIEVWIEVWKRGFGPFLPIAGMRSLLDALVDDDQRLIQGATTSPPPLLSVQNWPCEAADIIGWCFFGPDATVGEVEEGFARACFDADIAIKESAACRWVIDFWDHSPREWARAQMIYLVADSLVERRAISIDEAALYKTIADNLDDQAPRNMLKDWKMEYA